MSKFTISLTAPRCSFEDIKEERRGLSEAEICEIDEDVSGFAAIPIENDETVARSIQQFQEALNLIPPEEKQVYLEALERCPQLVEQETHPIRFLRRDKFDTEAASRRLVKYWQMRRKVFGDRAFLPLKLTGHDAFTPDDIEHMKSGAVMLLPKDEMGRAVFYLHRVRIDHVETAGFLICRLAFYVFNAALEDELVQRHGFVTIWDTRDKRMEKFDRKNTRVFFDMIRECLPIKIRATHVCFPAPRCVALIFVPMVLWLMGKRGRQLARFHTGGPKELLMDLEEYRLSKEGIPDVLGGTFKLEQFLQWMTERRELEDIDSTGG